MKNRDIAAFFNKLADMMAIRGDNFHRINAYRRGAESISGLGRALSQIAAEGKLTGIPGIGKVLAEKIVELLETGDLAFYRQLSEDVPATLVEMLRVDGVGPKRVKLIYDQLGISTLDELMKAAEAGELSALPGLGKKSEAKIVLALKALAKHGDDRTPIGDVWPVAEALLADLRHFPGVVEAAVGGSLRRMRETVGDVDLLIAVDDESKAAAIMAYFVALPQVESVSGHGATKSSVVLLSGLQVDLRIVPVANWGTLLSYFTGSKGHNVRLRELAQKRGWSLNEYRFQPEDGGDEILCRTEAAVYETLGLPYIMPTLRQDKGEIEAAQENRLPKVIVESDIIADLHMHTTWSDGKMSVREMAEAAKGLGRAYIVITDHSRSLGIANGLSIERLRLQAKEVAAVNEAMGADFTVLHGTEMEIKADGSLDYPDEVLAELDFVIASLHVGLGQPRAQVMARALAAIDNPHVDMLAHPTGRLLGRRVGADLDIDQLIMAASWSRTILEINANPQRLDLKAAHARRAAAMGVKLAINCDAHHVDHFGLLHYGIGTAQRGWVSAESVVNTWPLERFLAFINRV